MTLKKVVRKIFQIIGIIVAVLIVLIFVLMRFIAPKYLFKTEDEQKAYMQKAGQEMPTFGTWSIRCFFELFRRHGFIGNLPNDFR
jgi:predicted membrane protein